MILHAYSIDLDWIDLHQIHLGSFLFDHNTRLLIVLFFIFQLFVLAHEWFLTFPFDFLFDPYFSKLTLLYFFHVSAS